jgi:hypothetical protein
MKKIFFLFVIFSFLFISCREETIVVDMKKGLYEFIGWQIAKNEYEALNKEYKIFKKSYPSRTPREPKIQNMNNWLHQNGINISGLPNGHSVFRIVLPFQKNIDQERYFWIDFNRKAGKLDLEKYLNSKSRLVVNTP